MNRRKFIRNISIGAAGAGLGLMPLQLAARNDLVTISILHTNDLHSHIEPFSAGSGDLSGKGGLAQISGLVKKFRAKNSNTLLFDCGDMFQGTPYYNYYKGEFILKIMSEMGYNAGTLGNHEFDDGLEGIFDSLPAARFPLINSNYDFSETILTGKFPRWKIFNQDGIKIGVYGLGIELQGLVADTNFGKTVYKDPLKTALEMETFLKNDKKCHLVICLSHLGLRYEGSKISDLALAAETNFTDLIIGGHTHSYIEEPILLKNKARKQVIVNQASWGGLVLGKIDFIFDPSKKQPLVLTHNITIENEA